MRDLDLLARIDLDAVLAACTAAGLRVEPFTGRLAGKAVRVHTTHVHTARLGAARSHATGATLPLTRELADWAPRLAETIALLRDATGDVHVHLGPTTTVEAAFAAASPSETCGDQHGG